MDFIEETKYCKNTLGPGWLSEKLAVLGARKAKDPYKEQLQAQKLAIN